MSTYKLPVILLLFSPLVWSRTSVDDWDACGGRLERALDALHRDSSRRNRLEEEEAGTLYQQELRSAPLEMSVSRIAVKLPKGARDTGNQWARVEWCLYEPVNSSLQTRVMFNDLSVSGMVSLMPRDHQLPVPAETCRMTLRLRRAGIDFLTSPIARGRGQMRIRTESSFLEPRFASIYAYGCHPTRLDKQIKRQDKWPPFYPPRDEYGVQPPASGDKNYEAAEPRQLVGVSKEVDVVIPNETRQPRFLHAPVAKLGIWRKNYWVTKSPIRERRSTIDQQDSILKSDTRYPQSLRSQNESVKSGAARRVRSTPTITPQDFADAITNRRKKLEEETNRTTLASVNESFTESTKEKETKSNVKREDSSRETRELFLDDDEVDDAFPLDYDDGSRSWQAKEDIAREMEDVFLRGASQALTRYIEKQLHPAIKETLMLSMGYTISYG